MLDPKETFHNELEKLSMFVENKQQEIDKNRAALPQKGFRGWLHAKGLTRSSRQLNLQEKDVHKVATLLTQYKLLEPTLDAYTIDPSLLQDINKKLELVESKTKELAQKRQQLAKKASSLVSLITKSDKTLKQIVEEKKTAKQDFTTALSALYEAKKEAVCAAVVKKEEGECEVLFDNYKNIYYSGRPIEKSSVFYLEPEFIQALNNPSFVGFADEMRSLLSHNPKRLAEPFEGYKGVLEKINDILKGLKLPGESGQVFVPFLRLLFLKMDDPSILRESNIEKLVMIAEQCQQESSKNLNLIAEQTDPKAKSNLQEQVDQLDQGAFLLFTLAQHLEALKENLREQVVK